MRLSLPRFRRTPKHVVFIGADGSRRFFRVGMRWDGAPRLRERSAARSRRGALLVVDSALPLRRLFRIPARLRGTRNVLLATAADAFPFDVDEGLFALGERDAKSYVFALERSRFDELTEDVAKPAAVLVASSGALADVLAAVSGWLRDGPVRDMLGGPRPLRPATFLLLGQALVLAGLAWFAVDSWMARNQTLAEQRQQLLELTRAQAEPLLEKRRSVFRMVEVDRALRNLHELPAARLATRVGSIIGALPEGTRIERIRLEGQQLVISGWGEDPAQWLDDAAVSVKTKKYPKIDSFELTLELAR